MVGKLLIKNGTVVNDDRKFIADVLCEDGIIKTVGLLLPVSKETTVIDASGKYVMPGGIDTHTHMQLPFMGMVATDDFQDGTRAALAGGTTMIIDFVLGSKGQSLLDSFNQWRGWADHKVCCDYSLHMGVTWWSPQVSKEMEIIATEKGVNSFALYRAYKDILMLTDEETLQVLKHCKKIGALPLMHAKNGTELSTAIMEGHLVHPPPEVEAKSMSTCISLAKQAECPVYFTHVMGKSAANIISRERKQGYLFGEIIAASLGGDRQGLGLQPDHLTSQHLMDLLVRGDLDVTGSDNCAFQDIYYNNVPNGVNGVEDRMSVVWEKGVHSGTMDPCRFVSVTSTTAAKIFNLYPQKGCIAEGSDADIVVWDGNATRVISAKAHHQAVDFNIFEGMEVHGVPAYVISQGRVVVEKGEVKAVRASGKFIPRQPWSDHIYSQGAKAATSSVDAEHK